MIQTSTRADRRREAREARKSAKLKRKAFGIANRKRSAEGKPPKNASQKKPAKPGTLAYALDAQDTNQIANLPQELIEPFIHELRRRANIITKRKMKHQTGVGKHFPAGKHRNCNHRGISPKLYYAAIDEAIAA